MASKRQTQLMQIELEKLLNRRPEIIEQKKLSLIVSHMANVLTIVLDWMIRRFGYGRDECEELMDYVLEQLAQIGQDEWETFFDDVDNILEKEIGFTPTKYINEHLRISSNEENSEDS